MSDTNLKALCGEMRRAAEAATPGGWTLGGATRQRVEAHGGNLTVAFFGGSLSVGVSGSFQIDRDEACANAAFAATANPQNLLSILDYIGRLEETLDGMIRAWEALPEGNYPVSTMQRWIVDDLKPAIDGLRALRDAP